MYPPPHPQGGYDKHWGGVPVPAPPPGIPISPRLQQQQYTSPYPPAGMQGVRQPDGSIPWSTGLCHCCDDPANCLITCFCPCITFGQIAEIVDRGSTKATILQVYPWLRGERGRVRAAGADGAGVPLLVLLPGTAAGAVQPAGGAHPRLPRPLLLRVLRPLPGVPRAPQPRLRHGHRYVMSNHAFSPSPPCQPSFSI